jgi:transposase-like protein
MDMGRESQDVWAKRVERWRDSGLTVKEFAAEIGVNANTLSGWRWRLRPPKESGVGRDSAKRASHSPSRADTRSVAWVEVARPTTPVHDMHAPEPIEVVLVGGRRLRVPAQFDADALRRVIAAVESC